MVIVTTDSEYIPENAVSGEKPGPRPDVMETYCEVIQIGACRLANDGGETKLMSQLVRAHQIPHIPPWLEQMTGITNERRQDEGVHFKEALEEFIAFAGNEQPWCFSGDSVVLAGNCAAHGIPFPFQRPFFRVRPRLEGWGVSFQDYLLACFFEMNSGDLHKVLNIELPNISGVGTHDALHDACSIAHSLHHFKQKFGNLTTQSV